MSVLSTYSLVITSILWKTYHLTILLLRFIYLHTSKCERSCLFLAIIHTDLTYFVRYDVLFLWRKRSWWFFLLSHKKRSVTFGWQIISTIKTIKAISVPWSNIMEFRAKLVNFFIGSLWHDSKFFEQFLILSFKLTDFVIEDDLIVLILNYSLLKV